MVIPVNHHRIDISPIAAGRYSVTHRGAVIGEWANPECAAAFWLIARAHASPDEVLTSYRDGRPCLSAPVGWLARQTAIGGKS
jgi:hypothetical protein